MNLNDVLLADTDAGGDYALENEDFALTVGIDNNIYLCLFSGNVEDNPDETRDAGELRLDHWGNSLSDAPDSAFASRFERALISNALDSQGRARIEAAARQDLKPLEKIGKVEVSATIPALNRLELTVTVTEKLTGIPEQFIYIWDSEKEQLAKDRAAEVVPQVVTIPNIPIAFKAQQVGRAVDGSSQLIGFEDGQLDGTETIFGTASYTVNAAGNLIQFTGAGVLTSVIIGGVKISFETGHDFGLSNDGNPYELVNDAGAGKADNAAFLATLNGYVQTGPGQFILKDDNGNSLIAV